MDNIFSWVVHKYYYMMEKKILKQKGKEKEKTKKCIYKKKRENV